MFYLIVSLLCLVLLSWNNVYSKELNKGRNDISIRRRKERVKVANKNLLTLTNSTNSLAEITLTSRISEYVGIISMGTPAVEYEVVFDTGSSDIWLIGKDCINCYGGQTYDYTTSSTGINLGQSYTIQYVSGGMKCTTAQDTMVLGGITVSSQIFGVATSEQISISNLQIDGIVGLGFNGLAQFTSPLPTTTLSQQYGEFSVYLNPYDLGSGSKITLGGYDTTLAAGSTWNDISLSSNLYYWQLAMTGAYLVDTANPSSLQDGLNNLVYESCSSTSPCFTIVDTGSTGIGVPALFYQNVINLINSNLKCTNSICAVDIALLPSVLFSFGSTSFSVLPEDYITCPDGECYLLFQPMSVNIFILGDAFIAKYYTKFDIKNNLVSFACKGDCITNNGTETLSSDLTSTHFVAMISAAGLFLLVVFGIYFHVNKRFAFLSSNDISNKGRYTMVPTDSIESETSSTAEALPIMKSQQKDFTSPTIKKGSSTYGSL